MSQLKRPLATNPAFRPTAMPSAPAADVSWKDPSQFYPLATLAGIILLLVAAYWDMLRLVYAAWKEDALYSHGYIIPVFALGIMWLRYQPFRPVPAFERWIGLGIIVAALLVRLWGVHITSNTIDRITFPLAVLGAIILVGGFHAVRWGWPGPLFLVFMFPLPSVLEQNILWRLQTLASIASTFVLQTLGVPAFRDGNVINVAGMPLFIADACSGLRMATIFGALALAMVFLVERPWWDKFVILLSAIPIALLVNVIRITCTGLLYMVVGHDSQFAHKLAHDWAGYFMMPLALGFLWLELQILERLTIPVETGQMKPIGGRAAAVPVR